jgi:putative holliday junction resolvase
MKYLGIDFGSKRLGLSVSDADGHIAFPRGVISLDSNTLSTLADIVEKERIGKVVVGDTRSLGGAENNITAEADAFCGSLSAKVAVPVERTPEAWSSYEAGRFAPKGHAHDDDAAAAIILQRYLDMQRLE